MCCRDVHVGQMSHEASFETRERGQLTKIHTHFKRPLSEADGMGEILGKCSHDRKWTEGQCFLSVELKVRQKHNHVWLLAI